MEYMMVNGFRIPKLKESPMPEIGKYGSMRLRAGGSGTEGLCRTGGMELHRRPGHRSRFLSSEMLRF